MKQIGEVVFTHDDEEVEVTMERKDIVPFPTGDFFFFTASFLNCLVITY